MRKRKLTYRQILFLIHRLLRTTNDVTGNTLYASSDVYVRNGAFLRCVEPGVGGTKQANIYHDGTDMQVEATSGDIKFHGGVLKIDRATDKVYFSDMYIDTIAKLIQGVGTDATVESTAGKVVLKTASGQYTVIASVKTTTGDPAGESGMIYINEFDNVVKIYADGAWRVIASW